MLKKIWCYKILVSLTLVLQLSLAGWSLMTTAIVADTIGSGNLDALTTYHLPRKLSPPPHPSPSPTPPGTLVTSYQ